MAGAGLSALGQGGISPWSMAAPFLPGSVLTGCLGVGPTRGVRRARPAPVAAEQVAGGWILDVLDLPRDAVVGFPTGAQAANTIGLLAARHHVLALTASMSNEPGSSGPRPSP